MYRWLARLSWWFAIAGGLVAGAVALMVVSSVLLRALLTRPIPGDVELTQFGIALCISLCLPWCQLRRANLIVDFFAKNTSGWTVAKTLADGLVFSIRMVVGAVTLLTGIFQVFMALGSQIGQMFSEVFSLILSGVSRVMKSMAALAEAAGFEGLADSLAEGSRGAREMAQGASEMGQMYGEEAANSFAAGVQNIGSPFAAFDREFAANQAQAATVASSGVAAQAGETIGSAIRAASSELQALVVGSSSGESYRNMLARGGDPRLAGGDAAKETADNTERTADGVEELASTMSSMPGFGQAQIAMV